tara:strand:+ start:3593 stop:4297 length:705 start_codon:yes stop_codon:yes gene_type:complete
MSLPKINFPTYELEVPSTKDKITYRPFLVKEEKILLLAMEESDEAHIARALKQIVANCTFDSLDVNTMPLFDLEYIFLNIRAKSVGETADLKLLCPDDNKTYAEVSLPLNEVKVEFSKDHTNEIKVTDDITIIMAYPTYELLGMNQDEMTMEKTFKLIEDCTARVIDGETIHERADFNSEDLREFYDSLSSQQFLEVQKFFETMPRLRHKIEVINPKTKKKNKITLEGLQSFFE